MQRITKKRPDLGKVLTTPTSGEGRTSKEIEQTKEAQSWIKWRQEACGWEYLSIMVNPFAADASDAMSNSANQLINRKSMFVVDHVMGVAFCFEQPSQFTEAARHFTNTGK